MRKQIFDMISAIMNEAQNVLPFDILPQGFGTSIPDLVLPDILDLDVLCKVQHQYCWDIKMVARDGSHVTLADYADRADLRGNLHKISETTDITPYNRDTQGFIADYLLASGVHLKFCGEGRLALLPPPRPAG